MELIELFSMLSYGELSNLALSNMGSGEITEDRKPQIVQFANEGLLRLHTKFVLLEKTLIIELQESITNYHLLSQFAVQSFDPAVALVPYIIDLPLEKFEDDVIKVLSVENSWRQKRPLNDPNRWDSCFTPSALILQVPNPGTGEVLYVPYQARHKKLGMGVGDEKTITLSDTLHGALTAFIAYKVYQSMNTQESLAIAQGHISMFDSICADAVEYDSLNTSMSSTNIKFYERGWK